MDYVIQPAGNRYIVRVESPNTKRAYQIRFVSKPTEQDIQDALKQLDSLPLQQAMQFRIPDRAGAQSPSVSMRSQSQSRSALPNIPAIADISQWKGLTPERLQEYNQQVEESKKRIAEDQSASALVKGLYGILNIPLRAKLLQAVGATFTKGGEVYGKEAGKPAQIPQGDWQQRFWALATDPEMEYGASTGICCTKLTAPCKASGYHPRRPLVRPSGLHHTCQSRTGSPHRQAVGSTCPRTGD